MFVPVPEGNKPEMAARFFNQIIGLVNGGFDWTWQSIVKWSFSITSKLRFEIIVWLKYKLTSGLSI